MILNRSCYNRVNFLRAIWRKRQVKKILGEKLFKIFNLQKTEWPQKIYFYSPRLKRVPVFSGNIDLLMNWKDSRKCETICPTNAIKVTESSIVIDQNGCIACGLCVEISPPGLLEIRWDPYQLM